MVASRMAEGTVTEGWLHDTLEQLIAQIRTLLDVTGVAFVTVDEERNAIRPAAAWFTSDEASRAFTPLLDRPYDPERGGVTEAAVERGETVLITDMERLEGRRRAACPPARAARPASRAGRVGLVPDVVVHLLPGPHRERPDARRARAVGEPAATAAERGAPARDRGLRAASPRSRSSAPSCSSARRAARATEELLHGALQRMTASLDLETVYARSSSRRRSSRARRCATPRPPGLRDADAAHRRERRRLRAPRPVTASCSARA